MGQRSCERCGKTFHRKYRSKARFCEDCRILLKNEGMTKTMIGRFNKDGIKIQTIEDFDKENNLVFIPLSNKEVYEEVSAITGVPFDAVEVIGVFSETFPTTRFTNARAFIRSTDKYKEGFIDMSCINEGIFTEEQSDMLEYVKGFFHCATILGREKLVLSNPRVHEKIKNKENEKGEVKE